MSPATEEKFCATCGRRMTWRARWKTDWDEVKYCGERCRRSKPTRFDRDLERAILERLDQRARGATICPSEVARAARPEDWRPLMEPVRAAARRLVVEGKLVICQKGRVVDASTARGAIRLRKP